MEHTISITTQAERKITDTKSVPFGKIPTEHMFMATYKDGQWHNAQVTPFHEIALSPLALCFHYGQTVFEGMKAFAMQDGKVNVFRIEKHYERFSKSLYRMCMPHVPKKLFADAIKQLVKIDAAWVPREDDGALYIRPFMIATEDRIGIKASDEYLFLVVCMPAFKYYSKPLRVKVETNYVRAANGGTGITKCGGNYGGALFPTHLAQEAGFDQVLWTDAIHHEFIEESGTMNAMFFIDNVLVTPELSGTILDGVTRSSLLTLAREKGIQVEERLISYHELVKAFEAGKRVEAFGAGTAAVVAPIEVIAIGHKEYKCYIEPDAMMFQLQKELHDIRKGLVADKHGWNDIID
jgi:branched-chain amino acid aminotransferase